MSTPNKKFRGFADLYAVQKKKQVESEPQAEAVENISQPVEIPDKVSQMSVSEPLSTTPHQSPPLPPPSPRDAPQPIAPERDFNKRPNSLERDALPSGFFPGSTKKLYDALYLRTRGAVRPINRVRASRRDLLTWTGIRNLKTIDNHIRYLMAKGLIIRHWELGSNEGASYEVVLPEELFRKEPQPLSTTGGYSGDSPPLSTTTQKTSSGYTQKLGSGGEGQTLDFKDTYEFPKTIKTNTDDDDEGTLKPLVRKLRETQEQISGAKLSRQDTDKWGEVAEVLAEELIRAATKTNSISSVPAFLAEHLRRKFNQPEKKSTPKQNQQNRDLNRQGSNDGTVRPRPPAPQKMTDQERAEAMQMVVDLVVSGSYTLEQAEEQFAASFGEENWRKIKTNIETGGEKASGG